MYQIDPPPNRIENPTLPHSNPGDFVRFLEARRVHDLNVEGRPGDRLNEQGPRAAFHSIVVACVVGHVPVNGAPRAL